MVYMYVHMYIAYSIFDTTSVLSGRGIYKKNRRETP